MDAQVYFIDCCLKFVFLLDRFPLALRMDFAVS